MTQSSLPSPMPRNSLKIRHVDQKKLFLIYIRGRYRSIISESILFRPITKFYSLGVKMETFLCICLSIGLLKLLFILLVIIKFGVFIDI